MPMGLTKLGAAIISVIIAATLTALFAEIMYVLCRRRHRLGGRVRAEPQGAAASSVPSCSLELEVLEQRATKWGCASRMLFTIKEGEREGLDSNVSSAETSVIVL